MSSLPGADKAGFKGSIELAAAAGFDGLMANNLYEISPNLDEGEIAGVRQMAAEKGVRIASSFGGFHPQRDERSTIALKAGEGDIVAGAKRLAEIAARTGIGDLFFFVGFISDREDKGLLWSAQLAAVRDGLLKVAPSLRDVGARMLLKTHEEISTFEILELIEAVGADVLGVSHDPVNVVCRIEDPVAATRRLAPFIHQVHLDDASLHLDGAEVRRYLAPIGEGDLDWPAMLAMVPNATRWVEIHRGQFAMACFEQSWMAEQPKVTIEDYCFVAGAAVRRGNVPALCDQGAPYRRVEPLRLWANAHA